MATDDPEGFHYWELADEARAGDQNVHLLSNIQQVGNVQINAFQRAADVVMQKSFREGFGLTVSEGLWKGRPVVGGRCGGITLQIEDGVNGYLVDDVESAAKRTADLLRDPAAPTRWAPRAGRHVRSSSSRPASSRTGCGCSAICVRAVIVVSHRGPYRFGAATTARSPRTGAPAASSSALGAVARGGHGEHTWIAAAMSDDDRAAARPGATGDLDIDLRLLELDPDAAPLHYDVVSNGVLWFLLHGMFDRVRRPRFDMRFRDAWDAYVAVNEAFADAVGGSAPEGDVVLVQDYQLALVPGAAARAAARPARRALHPHPVLRPRRHPRPARPTSPTQLCASLAAGPPGSTRNAGPRRTSSRHARCSARGDDAAAVRREPRPRRRRARARSRPATTTARAAAALAEVVGDRLVIVRSDRIELSKNIVRGFLAFDRLLEARPGLRGRVVFVAMLYPSRQGLRRVPRVRERGRTGRRPRQRPLGDARLAADRARRPRRLPPIGRRACSATTCCS